MWEIWDSENLYEIDNVHIKGLHSFKKMNKMYKMNREKLQRF